MRGVREGQEEMLPRSRASEARGRERAGRHGSCQLAAGGTVVSLSRCVLFTAPQQVHCGVHCHLPCAEGPPGPVSSDL